MFALSSFSSSLEQAKSLLKIKGDNYTCGTNLTQFSFIISECEKEGSELGLFQVIELLEKDPDVQQAIARSLEILHKADAESRLLPEGTSAYQYLLNIRRQ